MKKLLCIATLFVATTAKAQFTAYQPVTLPQQQSKPECSGFGIPFTTYEPLTTPGRRLQARPKKRELTKHISALSEPSTFNHVGLISKPSYYVL